MPLSAHAGLDYTLAAATIAVGVVAGIARGTTSQQSFWSGSAPRIWR